VDYEARWDHPRAEAILRKIRDASPDLVLKRAEAPGYPDTDWNLVRQSPCHLWLVREEGRQRNRTGIGINRLLTGVGMFSDSEEIIAASDYEVFQVASVLADSFGAENVPVHAREAPRGAEKYSSPTAEEKKASVPVPDPGPLEKNACGTAGRYGAEIEAFVKYFDISPELMQVRQGKPARILRELAGALYADIIVMGAITPRRRERITASPGDAVPAEFMLMDTHCDLLFVRNEAGTAEPSASRNALRGVPA